MRCYSCCCGYIAYSSDLERILYSFDMASNTVSRAPIGLQQKAVSKANDEKSTNKPELINSEQSDEPGSPALVLSKEDTESNKSPNKRKSFSILSDTSDNNIYFFGSEKQSRNQDLELSDLISSLETSYNQEKKLSGLRSAKDSSASENVSDGPDGTNSPALELPKEDMESNKSPNKRKSISILSDTSDSNISFSGSEQPSRTQDLELSNVRSSPETSYDQENKSFGLGSAKDSSASEKVGACLDGTNSPALVLPKEDTESNKSPNKKKSFSILSDASDSNISLSGPEQPSRNQDLELSDVRSSLETSYDQENKPSGLGSAKDSSASEKVDADPDGTNSPALVLPKEDMESNKSPNKRKSFSILSDASDSNISFSGSEQPSRNQDLESSDVRSSLETSYDQEKKSSSSVSEKVSDGPDRTNSLAKTSGSAKVGERAEFIVSEKSSMCRGSTSSDVSDESTCSSFSSSINKPHKANDVQWEAIQAVRSRDGALGLSHFRLLKQLGCGDIGSVYLAELSGTKCYFAMKVMDKASLASRKKLVRAQTEKEILQSLDHPFLPTLYNHFETDKFSCLVMEFCPGGDLHTLRQRQPGRYFSEQAAKFYVAEVLLSLEYLHMLGIVYRDLKPENVLVRDDGHIMLSDFDLSLRCAVSPTLVKSSSLCSDPQNKNSTFCLQPACIEPSCIQPSCVVPKMCFSPRLFSSKSKKIRKPKNEMGNQVRPLPELIAEPTNARSMSFVGTHEYLAPEIIKGEGHGSPVDWWTLGIFLYELLFAKTPFKGSGNRATLFNVVGQPLRFPESPVVSFAARDLIRGLLVKEPQHRLGYKRGATEIKQHPFFDGVNWALIRCASPPDIPKPVDYEQIPGNDKTGPAVADNKYLEFDFF